MTKLLKRITPMPMKLAMWVGRSVSLSREQRVGSRLGETPRPTEKVCGKGGAKPPAEPRIKGQFPARQGRLALPITVSLVLVCVLLAVVASAQDKPKNPAGTFIHKWQVCGPFENAGGLLDPITDNDGALDPSVQETVKGREWKVLNSTEDIINLEMKELYSSIDHCIAFAFAEIESDKEGDVILGLGSDDSAMAWWNGRRVLAQEALRGTTPGEDQVHLHMKKGKNTLLVKIYDAGGGWGFAADLRAANGKDWKWESVLPLTDEELFDLVQKSSFDFYWEAADPETGLVPDSAPARDVPTKSPCSVAAVGFGLTAICVADSRGWVDHEEARARVIKTLKFLLNNVDQERGFFYHFVGMKTGKRVWNCELSSIDTALCLFGVLTCKSYFNDPQINELADALYRRVEWDWMMNGGDTLSMGWFPDKGFIGARWNGYSEHMAMYLLAIGSPTHPIPVSSWYAWPRPYFSFNGMTYVQATPLFLHQYAQIWVDFRDQRDAYADYFKNSALATVAHRDFCLSLQDKFPSYTENLWGVTASKGRRGYMVWGGPPGTRKYPLDGTVVPCAAGGSVAFVPDLTIPVLREMYEKHKRKAWGRFGFYDAFNPLTRWSAYSYLGIDVGPTMLMIENHRTGNVWKWFMDNPEISQTMRVVGFKRTGWQIDPADVDYLTQLAEETWACIAYFVNPDTGLPYDTSEREEFTSVSNIGLYLAALAAARDMGFISEQVALARAGKVIDSVEQFPTWKGFAQCWHSVKDLSPSPHDTWVSVVDAGNFALGLRVAAQAFPELGARCNALLDAMDWKAIHDKSTGQLMGGYDMKNKKVNPDWHVDMLGTDSRAAVFAAVASGDVPGSAWDDLKRDMEERYEVKYLKPGWAGGGLFMQYLNGIFVDERDSLVGRSAANLAYANMRNADEKNLPVWGWSSCADPDGGGYIGWGKLRDEVVTPHASVLAVEDFPLEVVENLYGLQMMGARAPWTKDGPPYRFGFRDSVNLASGRVSDEYLVLDQSMLFLSLANFLHDGLVREYLSNDPAVQDAYVNIPELSVPEGGANVSIYEPGYAESLPRASLRRQLEVRRTDKPPVIDGDLSDWGKAATATIWHPDHTEIGSPATGEEFQGAFRFTWDDEALYIAAEVTDDEIVCDQRGPKLYADDAVEIFIDPRNDGFIWGNNADMQLGISPTGPKGVPQKYAWFQSREPKDIEVASKLYESVSPASYTIEVKIPWTSLGLVGMHPGAIIPLSFAVHTVNKSRDASAKLNWSYSEEADGIRLGEIRLVE